MIWHTIAPNCYQSGPYKIYAGTNGDHDAWIYAPDKEPKILARGLTLKQAQAIAQGHAAK